MAISGTKERSRVDSYPYPLKEGQRYINLNPGRVLVQQPPKRERAREAHLNYYASAYNRGRQLSHRKTKLNQLCDLAFDRLTSGSMHAEGLLYSICVQSLVLIAQAVFLSDTHTQTDRHMRLNAIHTMAAMTA